MKYSAMKENRVLTDTGYNADAPQKRYAKQKKKKDRGSQVIWVYLCETLRVGRSIETESGQEVVARDLEEEEMSEYLMGKGLYFFEC